jgi:hypothetical protein
VNRHATLQKHTNVLSRRRVFDFITNNPVLVDPLAVESVITSILNSKIFKVRGPMGRFCDISEIFFGKMRMITPKSKCKNSE